MAVISNSSLGPSGSSGLLQRGSDFILNASIIRTASNHVLLPQTVMVLFFILCHYYYYFVLKSETMLRNSFKKKKLNSLNVRKSPIEALWAQKHFPQSENSVYRRFPQQSSSFPMTLQLRYKSILTVGFVLTIIPDSSLLFLIFFLLMRRIFHPLHGLSALLL